MDSYDVASMVHHCMALKTDATLLLAIEILDFAIEAFEAAQRQCEALGAAPIKILNLAQKIVDGFAGELRGLQKLLDEQNEVCSKECTFKIKVWKPKIYWKPGGCYKLIFKRIKACISMVFIAIAIGITHILLAYANTWLMICRKAMEVILKIIEAIMKAAKLVLTLAMNALKVIQLALFFLLNMLRRAEDIRPAIKCKGINMKRFKKGFDKMDLLHISEMVFHMEVGPRNLALATSFTKRVRRHFSCLCYRAQHI
jgi:hypothetical protein